jgi:hypothetical protein
MMTRFLAWLLTCRLFEWVTTIIMLGMAATIIAYPDTLARGAFRYMLVAGFTPLGLGLFFSVVGCVRLTALIINGRSPTWGPRLRAVGAVGGVFIWSWMAVALAYLANDTGVPSIGIFNWVGLTLGEIVSCARASSDVRHPAV